jgi:shikimate kinase
MKLFLLGFMGSGKSKWGKKIAKQLAMPFFDLDDEVEKSANKSITELFQERGEDAFRLLESEVLANIIAQNETFVLSTGGGTPCFNNNMELMNQSGKTIYLNVDSTILYGRLKTAKMNRPLIANLSDDELKVFIEDSLCKRVSFYSKAAAITSDSNLTAKKILDLI